MIQKIYTIFDAKAHAYLPPFYMQNEKVAIRAFKDAVDDPKSNFYRHPEDYTLHCIGTFDDETAQLDTSIPFLVASANQVSEVQPELQDVSNG